MPNGLFNNNSVTINGSSNNNASTVTTTTTTMNQPRFPFSSDHNLSPYIPDSINNNSVFNQLLILLNGWRGLGNDLTLIIIDGLPDDIFDMLYDFVTRQNHNPLTLTHPVFQWRDIIIEMKNERDSDDISV